MLYQNVKKAVDFVVKKHTQHCREISYVLLALLILCILL